MRKSFTSKVLAGLRCGTLHVVGMDPETHVLTDAAGRFGVRDLAVTVLDHDGLREVRLSGRHNSVMPRGRMQTRAARFTSFPVSQARASLWCAELIDEAQARFAEAFPASAGSTIAVRERSRGPAVLPTSSRP